VQPSFGLLFPQLPAHLVWSRPFVTSNVSLSHLSTLTVLSCASWLNTVPEEKKAKPKFASAQGHSAPPRRKLLPAFDLSKAISTKNNHRVNLPLHLSSTCAHPTSTFHIDHRPDFSIARSWLPAYWVSGSLHSIVTRLASHPISVPYLSTLLATHPSTDSARAISYEQSSIHPTIA
jgi:hypothetical protein